MAAVTLASDELPRSDAHGDDVAEQSFLAYAASSAMEIDPSPSLHSRALAMSRPSAAAPDSSSSSCCGSFSIRGMKINSKVACGLTFVQFAFALYATYLLYFLSPNSSITSTGLLQNAEPAASMESPPLYRHSDSSSWMDRILHQLLFPAKHGSYSRSYLVARNGSDLGKVAMAHLCEQERIDFEQKRSRDAETVRIKQGLLAEVLSFQRQHRGGCETLEELLALPSRWQESQQNPKVAVILNHYRRRTLCAQIEALRRQTLQFHTLWVMAFGEASSGKGARFKQIIDSFNDSRISLISSSYDFKYYGRFQLALQTSDADYVYLLDDDMIPGSRVLEIFTHVAGTSKYANALLGSIGRILPFRQQDGSFPSYRKFRSREAGLYIPDPAYGIVVDRMVQVDFLSSSWFLSSELVKAMLIETPSTFSTGEDLHLSYQLQKYRDVGSYVLPVDPLNNTTWGDGDHRLAYIAEATAIHKEVIRMRDEQWWRTVKRGYVTRWAVMEPQQTTAIFYAHSMDNVEALSPLFRRFESTEGKTALLVVSGDNDCTCEAAAARLGLKSSVCNERRFRILDLGVSSIANSTGKSKFSVYQGVFMGMKGVLRIHSPTLLISVAAMEAPVRLALQEARASVSKSASVILGGNVSSDVTVVELPQSVIPHVLWMADVSNEALKNWAKMSISISVITQNRPASLERLLASLAAAHYVGDVIALSFHIDRKADVRTLRVAAGFDWPHGSKALHRRIIQGGLIRAVSESWYPASDHSFGLLLEDDVEVSPFFYLWLKYTLLAYHYDPQVSLPELNAIALYTPRIIEVVKERPRWDASGAFAAVHPRTPYLHQLPCSWGALFFPKHWREFYAYMGERYVANAKNSSVQIPRSRTNGWQGSWKKFLIDMMYLRGYVTLYPNFGPGQPSLSTNHVEPGAHVDSAHNALPHRAQDYEVPLLTRDFGDLLPDSRLPPPQLLPVIDLFNRPSTLARLRSAGASLSQDVLPCERAHIVIVDDATGLPLRCAPAP